MSCSSTKAMASVRELRKPPVRILAAGLIAFLLSGCGSVAQPIAGAAAVTLSGITYCHGGGEAQTFDLYEPASSGRHPLAVYIHGGGWAGGSATLSGFEVPLAGALVLRGIAVASINYRLSAAATWPAPIIDSRCALRFFRAHAAQYRIDPDRIGVYGSSAGGHLAALAGLAPPQAGFDGGDWGDQSSSVRAVVDLYGPSDLTVNATAAAIDSLVFKEFGAHLESGASVLREASPVTYISAHAPPFLIIHGDHDTVVPLSQSQELESRLVAAGVPAHLVVVKNAEHVFLPAGTGAISPSLPQIDNAVVDFFGKTL
jgi:acetyl esterase/lipase